MAASRTRKKTQDKNRKAAANKHQQDRQARLVRAFGSVLEQVPACTDCKGTRTRVAFDEVSSTARPGVDEMCRNMQEAGLQVGELVYCPNCNQYSALSSWNSF